MYKKLTHDKIVEIYNDIKHHIKKNKVKGNYNAALKYIELSAYWAYNFNFIYADGEVEDTLKDIAETNLGLYTIDGMVDNRYVFFDTNGVDNRGLTQQYLRALIQLGYEFLYIYISNDTSRNVEILKEIRSYDKGKVLLFNRKVKSRFEKCKVILDEIKLYRPSRILLHLMPWDTVSLMCCHCLCGPIKYNINLTDHAYWLGNTFINYNIEFRPYGMTVSLEQRVLESRQLLYLPYYPVRSKYARFQGFPTLPSDSIILFSGGSYYKMFGRDDAYFRMTDKILDISSKAVLLLAGSGEETLMKGKIAKMKNADRVVLIGNRKDIDEVFRHCDIYWGTYPISGGLMAQFAAMHSKPIIAYTDANIIACNIEGVVNHFGNGVKTFHDVPDMLAYASRLINDERFRIGEGRKNHDSLMTSNKFVEEFALLMSTHTNIREWETEKIDYAAFESIYIDVENNYLHSGISILIYKLKYSFWFQFPELLPITLPIFYKLVVQKMKKWRKFFKKILRENHLLLC